MDGTRLAKVGRLPVRTTEFPQSSQMAEWIARYNTCGLIFDAFTRINAIRNLPQSMTREGFFGIEPILTSCTSNSFLRRNSLAQPHLRPHHFVKLLQSAERPQNLLPQPAWLETLLDRVCDYIEPVSGEARVGFDLTFHEARWQIDLFLGRTVVVGGNLDGCSECVSFTADIPGILALFSKVESCEWLALPSSLDAGGDDAATSLFIDGLWGRESVRVTLRSVPPATAAAGLRRYADGHYELV